jgi:hypothetical protein
VANGKDPDITSSNFEAELNLISRLTDNFVHNGLLRTLHALLRVKHVRMSTDCARRVYRQRFDALPIRKIVFVEDNYVETELQGATDRHEVLQMFFA